MAKQFVSSLEDKQSIHSAFLIKEKFVLKGKNGKSYMSLTLADKSGVIDARIWDNVEELAPTIQPGEFVRVKGVVQLFQNRKQVVVHKVEKAREGDYELSDFYKVSAVHPKIMFEQLTELVETISDPFIKSLVFNVIKDPHVQPKLLQAPAAKTIHHAYYGGLLEHVLSICRLMTHLAEHYPMLNRDLLYFGAIFHDIGKLWELSFEDGTSYTDEGRLIGHLVMAVELIDRAASEIVDFPDELRMLLKHIVLSHHGKLEYGSPKTPQFLEAFVVAFVDDFDSKMNTLHSYLQNERESGERWSRYHQMFDRYFYLGVSKNKAYGDFAEKPKPPAKSPPRAEPPPPAPEPVGLVIPSGHDGLSYKNQDS